VIHSPFYHSNPILLFEYQCLFFEINGNQFIAGIHEMVENNRQLYDYIADRDVVSARACVIDYMDKSIEGDLEIYDT